MPSEIFDCRFDSLVDLDLLNAGIALDVKNAVGNQQIVVELLRAANVQDRVSLAIELPDFFQGQTRSWIARQIARAERPAIFETKLARQPVKNFRGVIELVGDFECFRVVRKAGRVFDVKNVVPEPLQADDVMDVLPDHACDRHRAHEAHDDNALAFHREENAQRPTLNVQHPIACIER